MLVDTSVWIEHFRRGHDGLRELLEAGHVTMHPFVMGELACGSLANRASILSLLDALPACAVANQDEALALVEQHRLFSTGLGWVDVHLLTAARLTGDLLMTLHAPLARAAKKLGVAALE
jgi:predicted nucleic acid-binding protein